MWIWHRVTPQKGLHNPNRPKLATGPDGYKDLHGSRRTFARVKRDDGGFEEYVLEDHWDIPQGWRHLNDEDKRVAEILRTREWTGITEYAKATVPEIFPEQGSTASSSSGVNATVSKIMATISALPTGSAELFSYNGVPVQSVTHSAKDADAAHSTTGPGKPNKIPKIIKNGEVDDVPDVLEEKKAKGGM